MADEKILDRVPKDQEVDPDDLTAEQYKDLDRAARLRKAHDFDDRIKRHFGLSNEDLGGSDRNPKVQSDPIPSTGTNCDTHVCVPVYMCARPSMRSWCHNLVHTWLKSYLVHRSIFLFQNIPCFFVDSKARLKKQKLLAEEERDKIRIHLATPSSPFDCTGQSLKV